MVAQDLCPKILDCGYCRETFVDLGSFPLYRPENKHSVLVVNNQVDINFLRTGIHSPGIQRFSEVFDLPFDYHPLLLSPKNKYTSASKDQFLHCLEFLEDFIESGNYKIIILFGNNFLKRYRKIPTEQIVPITYRSIAIPTLSLVSPSFMFYMHDGREKDFKPAQDYYRTYSEAVKEFLNEISR